jgi:hypothetical protein
MILAVTHPDQLSLAEKRVLTDAIAEEKEIGSYFAYASALPVSRRLASYGFLAQDANDKRRYNVTDAGYAMAARFRLYPESAP